MKIKSIIGISLIVLSVCGMYFWESGLREQVLGLGIGSEEPKHEEIDDRLSMVIPSEWIYLKNDTLEKGNLVSIYLVPDKSFLGKFEVGRTDVSDDEFIEILCYLNDYFKIYDALKNADGSSLLLVREAEL